MQLQPNTIVQSRYRIIALIAQGGMGAVYEAIDARLGNTVALKQTLVADAQLRSAFEREARLLAALHHPALPVVSDHFLEGNDQFLVMQFIPGDDLACLLSQRATPFGPEQVVGWADELLDALEYLHSHNPPIIHRDIKPQNLKIGPRGNLVLLDFGLAKGFLASGPSAGGGQSIFGYTPQYAPMEQIQGTGTDERSDLYALAATMYQLLTGQVPPDAISRAAATVAGRPDPLMLASSVNPLVPQPLAALLEQTLAQNPALRPQSATAMRAALRTTLQTVPVVAPAPLPTPVNSSGWETVAVGGGAAVSGGNGGGVDRLAAATVVANGQAVSVGRRRQPINQRLFGALVFFVLVLAGISIGSYVTSRRVSEAIALPQFLAEPTTFPTIDPAEEGATRANPLPAGSVVRIPGWEVQVLEVVRGREAWNRIYEANSSNDPAPEGSEFLLVKLRVNAQFSGEERQLYPKLTGAQRISRFATASVTPAPGFPIQKVAGGQTFEGWLPYLVPQGENNLILIIEEVGSFEATYPLYVALDEGAKVVNDPALREIEPNKKGVSPGEPVIFGETAVTEDWEVTLQEAIRGEAAMARLLEANQFNDPPARGMEYVVVRLEVRYIGSSRSDNTKMLYSTDFASLPGTNSDPETDLIRAPATINPEPEINAYLYPGGVSDGWTAIMVPINQPNPVLIFKPSSTLNDINVRYFALK
jgi:serine/threonine protein kinase